MFLMDTKGAHVLKDFDETLRLHFDKRNDWIREVRKERLHGAGCCCSSAPCLANSLAVSLSVRNE